MGWREQLLKPKPAAFKFGAVAMLFIGISLLFPLFVNIGAASFVTLAYIDMLLAGLLGAYIMSEALRKKMSEQLIEPTDIISMQNQLMIVIPVGLMGGVVAVLVNAAMGISGNLLMSSAWGVISPEAFYFGFLAGVAEELFFRGFWQSLFELWFGATMLGRILAIFPAALLFAAFHFFAYVGNPIAFAVMFGLGCVFGFIHAISKDIGTPILAHVVNNSIAMMPFLIIILQANVIPILILGALGALTLTLATLAYPKRKMGGKK